MSKFVSVGIVLSLLLCACATPPVKIAEIGDYEREVGSVSTYNNFAFELDGHSYYFAPRDIAQNGFQCRQYLGFKDGKLAYRFSDSQLKELRKTYEAKLNIEEKMRTALAQIEKFKMADNSCGWGKGKKIRSKWDEGSEAAMYFIIFSPVIPLSVVFGFDIWVGAVKDVFLEQKLKKVRLGMGPDKVPRPAGFNVEQINDPPYVLYQLKSGEPRRNLIFVYKNDRLIAYVWGT